MSRSNPYNRHFAGYNAPVWIPKQRTSWFMWALLALAALVVVGIGYSFWSIARVPNPTLDVNAEPAAPAEPERPSAPTPSITPAPATPTPAR